MSSERLFREPIDLHTHSRVSDGTESPAELVRAAKRAGLGTVALTDHDSTAGWAEAGAEALVQGVTLIPGMELSTRVGWSSVHLLAYLFDPLDPDLLDATARIREARLHRAEQMVERIARDYDLSWDDVLAQTEPGATVGRPHIADALVARGLAADRSAAFAGILHWRAGYYQPHDAPEPLEAVRLVAGAGGVPVIAHPATRSQADLQLEGQFGELVDAGLFGLEIDHRENTAEGRVRLERLARRYGLALTGSSDYHGSGKPNRLGENTTSPEVLDALIARATGSEPVYG
ncbi:PHP domain-containing protein [Herbiconiux moechotypicola]|uniref:PHP domain-containing protein n=1 Tax=Herbiconiux moechotypicola TaxID=637393 RepID=A0ABN3DMX1_9MICO|nr:PHP domain-containing protein [Herbiconiux moechotypicola]MCS5730323.1 PHP domain-containing protein [Herbiconiux moechotypicola]